MLMVSHSQGPDNLRTSGPDRVGLCRPRTHQHYNSCASWCLTIGGTKLDISDCFGISADSLTVNVVLIKFFFI